MKKLVAVAAAAAFAVWLGAQALAPSKAPAEIVPPGALFYVEARNFGGIVAAWDASPEKKDWLASANYQAFQRSHLLTRLMEARKGFTEAAGVSEEAPLLNGLAGGESAIAFYNIGKLEFLYTTRISAARFADSAISKVKQKFQPRKAGGHDYFVLAKGGNTIAFALLEDRLLLATREDLVATSLRLLANEKLGNLQQEPWFREAISKAPAVNSPDVRFVANMEELGKSSQFRSYWIHRNITELRQFTSAVADLRWEPTGMREDRVFLRREQSQAASAESAVADLMRYASPSAGFYQATAKPAAGEISAALAEHLFGHPRMLEGVSRSIHAPDAPAGPPLLGEDDYETRVDVPQTVDDAGDPFAALHTLATNADAFLQTGSARTTALLPSIETALVLHGVAAWKAADVKRALGQVAGAVWSAAPGSLEWNDRNSYSELNSLTPLRFAIDGNALLLSTSPEWLTRVLAGRRTAPGTPATYAASFRNAQEAPVFTRMMRLMDFPSIPQGQPPGTAREPLFFSENIASLAASLSRLDSTTITTHDTGALVSESLVYRKK